ncbi:Eco57I restriction-modification methylase domain-containing protein, partial [bacterium]|nr:Eco57I restriction-modification methylase domain-containing protein [bacterium]
SLIASDFSMIPEDLVRVRAFDWPTQFPEAMKNGGFDTVIGNPPYGADTGEDSLPYFQQKFEVANRDVDTYALFMEQSVKLARPGGFVSMIVPTGWYSGARFPALRRFIACETDPTVFVNLPYDVFADAYVDTTVYAAIKRKESVIWPRTEKNLVALKTFKKRQKIQSTTEFAQGTQTTEFVEWFTNGNDTFLTYADSRSTSLIRQLEKNGVPFSNYADIQRGVTPFNLTEKPTHRTSLRAFQGTVRRYFLDEGPARYIRFDDTLAEPKPVRYFQGPRLLIRELVSRQFQIQAVKVTKDFVTNKSMQSALPLAGDPDISFLLGCFNSRLLSWFFLQKSNIAQRDDFPKIVLKETRSLPFPKIDLKNRADKARHNRLVTLVEKMLALSANLREAKSESEKATLQNAITTTDAEIDCLVYELYGLTEEEIRIVEGEN